MDKAWWIVAMLGLAGALEALPQGGFEAKTDDGRLSSLGSWWGPRPDWEGRWWWRETGGSAWVRVGAVETGPLILAPGTEGWRRWYPGTTLSSGHWGLGVDGGPWGFWAVQDPEEFVSGVQGRVALDPWTLAAGAERSWTSKALVPATGAWVDRARGGVIVDTADGLAGLEGTAIVPAQGPSGWWGRGRATRWWGPWSWSAKGSGGFDPTPNDRSPWSLATTMGWDLWSCGWSGTAKDPSGRYQAGWTGRWFKSAVAWGPETGWEAGAGVHAKVAGVAGSVESSVAQGPKGWEFQGDVSADGRLDRGTWSAAWGLASGGRGPAQTVTAGWKEAALEAQARWKVEGLRLGWIGPGTDFDLTVRWYLF